MKEVVNPKRYTGSRRLKYATDKWLEYRYGWLPFVSSTYELLKTLSKKVDKATRFAVIEAKVGKKDTYFDSYGHGGNVKINGRHVDYSSRVLLKFRMRARTTLELYDFTSLNPAGIAWELVPLSFVADWFVNVGQTMSLWEDHILFANRFVSGFQTKSYREDVSRAYKEFGQTDPPVWPNGDQMDEFVYILDDMVTAKREFRLLDRSVLDSLPCPGGLRVDVNVNAKRMLDAASLLRGVFGNPRLK
jgi:hypothetical protein